MGPWIVSAGMAALSKERVLGRSLISLVKGINDYISNLYHKEFKIILYWREHEQRRYKNT
jgi:hypothetical protein